MITQKGMTIKRMNKKALISTLTIVVIILTSVLGVSAKPKVKARKRIAISVVKNKTSGDMVLKVKKAAKIYSLKNKKIVTTVKRGAKLFASEYKNRYAVKLSNGNRGFIKKSDIKVVVHSQKANKILSTAKTYLGTPYRSGGTSRSGVDCSGFAYAVYKEHGIKLSRSSWQQAAVGKKISRKNLKPGDLMFFGTGGGRISHTAIYVGKNKFIHATVPGGSVQYDGLNEAYYNSRFVTARRCL